MALHPLQGIELFSGVGMLGEGLRAGFAYMGIPYRAICHVEREAYTASVMVARMEEGSMDAAPVWSDVTTFDATAWRGKVDCIVAGFPCQDLSVAGKRAGLDGKRSGLFFEVTRIADDSGARLILLENVAGIASATATVMDEAEGELEERAAARVLGELADLGWDAEWITISASDVGASHGRARWFCLAWRMGNPGLQHQQLQQRQDGPEHQGENSAMDDAVRTERRAGHIERACGEQGNNAGRAEKNSGTGIAVETLGHTNQQRTHRSGSLGQQTGCGEPAHDDSELGDTEHAGRNAAEIGNGSAAGNGSNQTGQIADGESSGSGNSQLADTRNPRLQGNQQQPAHEQDGRTDGRTDGRSKNHADQLPNFVMYHFSHQGQTMNDGQKLSQESHGSAQLSVLKGNTTPRLLSRRLNPYFVEFLMGWRMGWTSTTVRSASSAAATELWRSKLQQQLSSLLDEPELNREAA